MKKIILFSLVSLLLSACSSDNDDKDNFTDVNTFSIDFQASNTDETLNTFTYLIMIPKGEIVQVDEHNLFEVIHNDKETVYVYNQVPSERFLTEFKTKGNNKEIVFLISLNENDDAEEFIEYPFTMQFVTCRTVCKSMYKDIFYPFLQ